MEKSVSFNFATENILIFTRFFITINLTLILSNNKTEAEMNTNNNH